MRHVHGPTADSRPPFWRSRHARLTRAMFPLLRVRHGRLASAEEAAMHARFGEAFERYARVTPRLLPRLRQARSLGASSLIHDKDRKSP